MVNSLPSPKKQKVSGTTWSSVSNGLISAFGSAFRPSILSLTGTPISPADYAKMNPNGRAILKGCQYRAALDGVCEEYPYTLATGRNHLHFHTRTKTGRSKRLRNADHDPYVQIHEEDAKKLDIKVGNASLSCSGSGELILLRHAGRRFRDSRDPQRQSRVACQTGQDRKGPSLHPLPLGSS